MGILSWLWLVVYKYKMSEIIDSYELELNESLNLASDRVTGSF